MPRVIHFDLRGEDAERAKGFYADVFGWKFDKWDGPSDYWLVTTGSDQEPGINGGFMKRERAEENTVLTIGVPSADEYADKIEKSGGTIIVPKAVIPGVGYIVTCRDTEGNVFGIIEDDPQAR